MGPVEIIALIIIILIVGSAAYYIIKAKKKGQKCIGCPYAKQCQKNKGNCSNQNCK